MSNFSQLGLLDFPSTQEIVAEVESPNFRGTVPKAPVNGTSNAGPTREAESHPSDESWETVDSEKYERDAILPSGVLLEESQKTLATLLNRSVIAANYPTYRPAPLYREGTSMPT